MILITGPHNVTVPGSSSVWTPGPIFLKDNTLRVQSSGAVAFRTANGGLVSSPATFGLNNTPAGNSQVCSFTIPVGSWSSASWVFNVTVPGGTTAALGTITVQSGASIDAGAVTASSVPSTYTITIPLDGLQIATVNAAAGGTLSPLVKFAPLIPASFTVNSFTLALTAITSSYALSEGAYGSSYPSSHAFSPGSVDAYSTWPGTYPVSDTVPLSLAAIVLPDGVDPNFLMSHTGGLRPNIDTTFDGPTLITAGAVGYGQYYRIWFIFNDAIGAFSDNTGSLSVIINRFYVGNTMAQPVYTLLRPQFGVEGATTYGTAVPATRMLTSVENSGFDINPEQTKEAVSVAGFGFNTDESLTMEMSKGAIKGMLEYRDLGYVLSSIYGPCTNTAGTAVSGVTPYTHVWEDMPLVAIAPQTYTYEFVKDAGQRVYSATGVVFLGLKLDTARDKQTSLSANLLGKILTDNASPSTGLNDVQTVSINGNPGGGSFGLVLDNQQLTGLSYLISTAALQTAIVAVPGWGSATVTGTAGTNYIITNGSGTFIPLILPITTDVNGAATLTGGTSPTVTVVHTTPGGMVINPFSRILPGQISVSWATNAATLSTNAAIILVNEFATTIDVADRFEPIWRQNATDVGHGGIVQKKPGDMKDTVTLTFSYDTLAAAWIANSRSNTKMFLRLKFTGAAIGSTGQVLSLVFDSCIIPTFKTFKDSQGNIHTVEMSAPIVYDIQSGFRNRWTLINDVATYVS